MAMRTGTNEDEEEGRKEGACGYCLWNVHEDDPDLVLILLTQMSDWNYDPLVGDDLYEFTCELCGNSNEVIKRPRLPWLH
jgi:hypothetical protein